MALTKVSIPLKFVQTKESKGAFMYTELMSDGRPVPTVADGRVGQIYIRKAALPITGKLSLMLEFAQTKESKGAFMFTELLPDGRPVPTVADGKVGQIYVRKAALPAGVVEKLLVQIHGEVTNGKVEFWSVTIDGESTEARKSA